jgi:anti-sigma factor (TIGR02949 family)
MSDTEHTECKKLLGSLSEFLDGSLESDICAEIQRHLAECENCRIVVDSLNKTIYLYQTTSQQVTVPDDVRERLFRCLDIEEMVDKGRDRAGTSG